MPWHEDFDPQINWCKKILNILLEDGRIVQLFGKTPKWKGLSRIEARSKEAQDRELVAKIKEAQDWESVAKIGRVKTTSKET